MGFQFQILLADKNLSSAAFRETALRRCVELLQKNHTGIDCRDKPPPTGNFLPALLTEAHFQQIAELPDLHGSPAFPHQPPAAVTGIEVRIETEQAVLRPPCLGNRPEFHRQRRGSETLCAGGNRQLRFGSVQYNRAGHHAMQRVAAAAFQYN